MKVYILIDENNIIRCIASEECNLHKNKLYMRKFLVEYQGIVGDEFNPDTKQWIKKPENYPQLTDEQIKEQKIQKEMRKIAIESLIAKGEL